MKNTIVLEAESVASPWPQPFAASASSRSYSSGPGAPCARCRPFDCRDGRKPPSQASGDGSSVDASGHVRPASASARTSHRGVLLEPLEITERRAARARKKGAEA